VNPEERELRKALDARSGTPSPEFRSRLGRAFAAGRPPASWMPAVAAVAVFAVCAATIGVLVHARYVATPPRNAASGARLVTPGPTPTGLIPMPNVAWLDAPGGPVWVVVAYDHLYRSTDHGTTWDRRQLPPNTVVAPMVSAPFSFIDDMRGWVLAAGSPETQCNAQSSMVWRTLDGGAGWTALQTTGIAGAQCKDGITFVDETTGFVTAWDDNSPPTVYRTSDGGQSWTATALPNPPDFKPAQGGFELRAGWIRQFGDTLYLEASGHQEGESTDRAYVFKSLDRGASWSWMEKIPSPYVAMVTESRWLLLIAPGQSQETTNSGQQWHPYASDFNTDTPVGGPQVVFSDSLVGYAEGRAALQRTVDGGLHWERIQTPGTANSG